MTETRRVKVHCEKEISNGDFTIIEVNAFMRICPVCKIGQFVIFTKDGQDHMHYQCTGCGIVYCLHGCFPE